MNKLFLENIKDNLYLTDAIKRRDQKKKKMW